MPTRVLGWMLVCADDLHVRVVANACHRGLLHWRGLLCCVVVMDDHIRPIIVIVCGGTTRSMLRHRRWTLGCRSLAQHLRRNRRCSGMRGYGHTAGLERASL